MFCIFNTNLKQYGDGYGFTRFLSACFFRFVLHEIASGCLGYSDAKTWPFDQWSSSVGLCVTMEFCSSKFLHADSVV